MTGWQHRVRKIVNSGTRLCSYIPESKNIVISKTYAIRTSNNRQGVVKLVSEFSPVGIIGAGFPESTIILEIFLGGRPDNFVDVLSDFKLKWTQAHANKKVRFTFEGIQHQVNYRLLDLNKIMLGPVALKRLRFTPGEIIFDQSSVIIGQ